MKLLFPSLVAADDIYNYFARLRIYVVELCDILAEPDINQNRLNDVQQLFLNFQTQNKPLNFTTSDPDNVLLKMDKRFVEMCSLMENNNSPDPHNYTVVQFYAKIDYLQKEAARLQAQQAMK